MSSNDKIAATFNLPSDYKKWLSDKKRDMTDIIIQLIEEEMYREEYHNRIRFRFKEGIDPKKYNNISDYDLVKEKEIQMNIFE